MIKSNGLYAVNGVYFPTQSGMDAINTSELPMLPSFNDIKDEMECTSTQASTSAKNSAIKKKRLAWKRKQYSHCCQKAIC